MRVSYFVTNCFCGYYEISCVCGFYLLVLVHEENTVLLYISGIIVNLYRYNKRINDTGKLTFPFVHANVYLYASVSKRRKRERFSAITEVLYHKQRLVNTKCVDLSTQGFEEACFFFCILKLNQN